MSHSTFNVPALIRIFAECVALGARKNHDYGAARDTIAANGIRGIATRMDDKQARIMSLTQPGHEPAVRDESLKDTLRDQINYSAYGIMLLDGTWGQGGAVPAAVTDLDTIIRDVANLSGVSPGLMRFAGYEMDFKSMEQLFKEYGRPLPTPPSSSANMAAPTAALVHQPRLRPSRLSRPAPKKRKR